MHVYVCVCGFECVMISNNLNLFQLNMSHNYCKKTTEDACEVLGTPDPAEVLEDPAKTTFTHSSRSDLRRQVLG